MNSLYPTAQITFATRISFSAYLWPRESASSEGGAVSFLSIFMFREVNISSNFNNSFFESWL